MPLSARLGGAPPPLPRLRQAPVAAVGHLAFRVRDPDDLDLLEAEFRAAAPRRAGSRRGRAGTWAAGRRPARLPARVLLRDERAEQRMQRFDIHRGAPVMRIDHFNLHVPEVEAAARFWLGLGFRCTSTSRRGRGRAPHRRLADAQADGPRRRPHGGPRAASAPRRHVGLEPAGVLHACDQVAAAGHADVIERGPEGTGSATPSSSTCANPDGQPDRALLLRLLHRRPRPGAAALERQRRSLRSFWGTRAPDSWYEESSLVLDLDGLPLELRDTTVDERTEMMA